MAHIKRCVWYINNHRCVIIQSEINQSEHFELRSILLYNNVECSTWNNISNVDVADNHGVITKNPNGAA